MRKLAWPVRPRSRIRACVIDATEMHELSSLLHQTPATVNLIWSALISLETVAKLELPWPERAL